MVADERIPAPPSPKYVINISELDYGFIVTVGCKSFAIESKGKVVAKIADYLADRAGTEKSFFAGSLDMK